MAKYKKHNLAIWSHCSPTTYLCTLTPLLNLLSFSLSHTTSLREPSQQREVSMYGFGRFLHTNKSKQSFLFGRIPSSQTGESVLPAYLIFLSYVQYSIHIPRIQHIYSQIQKLANLPDLTYSLPFTFQLFRILTAIGTNFYSPQSTNILFRELSLL